MIKNTVVLVLLFGQLTSCVQKTSKKTVVYILSVPDINSVKNVVIRGNDKPLSWQSDYEMKKNKSDSTYRAVVTYLTGYKFTEVKFLINNEFELQNLDNRRIAFSNSDTTTYTATFNVKK